MPLTTHPELGYRLAPKSYLEELLRELYGSLRTAVEKRRKPEVIAFLKLYQSALDAAGQSNYNQNASVKSVLERHQISVTTPPQEADVEKRLKKLQTTVAKRWGQKPTEFKKEAEAGHLTAEDFPTIPTMASIIASAPVGNSVYNRFTQD